MYRYEQHSRKSVCEQGEWETNINIMGDGYPNLFFLYI